MRAGGGHVDGERQNAVRRQRADRRDRLNAGLKKKNKNRILN